MLVIKFKKLDPRAVIPAYAKPGDSGFDLVAIENVTIRPGETKLVRTGLACELPRHHNPDMTYEMQVRPRSGLSLKTPLHIRNAPGTVDNGYRGELGIVCHCLPMASLWNLNNGPQTDMGCPSVVIKAGDRIAQAVIAEVAQCHVTEVGELSDTERGAGGYGHTGTGTKLDWPPAEDDVLDADAD